MPTPAQLVGVLFLVAGSVAAQGQTWVVDANGGPGSHFTNIPPALQVAQDGDTILVRGGIYDGGTITRGIAILAEAKAIVRVRVPNEFFGAALEVSGLPAGRSVVLEGLRPELSTGFFFGSFLSLRNCLGRVHCDNLDGDLFSQSSGQTILGISTIDCAYVSIHATSLRGGFPVSAIRSTLLITDSTLQGQSGFTGLGGSANSSNGFGCTDCQVTVARSVIQGGNGAFLGAQTPSAGISAVNGTLVIAGGAEAQVTAGSSFGIVDPKNGIAGSGTAITIDPRVTVTPSGGALPISAGHVVTTERVPALSAAAGPPGGTLELALLATAGDLVEMYLSLPFGPVTSPIPGSGEIWVSFAAFLNLGRYQVPASEELVLNFGIPAIPGVRGLAFTTQAVTLSTAAGFRFCTPVTFALN